MWKTSQIRACRRFTAVLFAYIGFGAKIRPCTGAGPWECSYLFTFQSLIQIIQGGPVVCVKRSVLPRSNAGQHPGIGVGPSRCSRNIDGSNGGGTFVDRLPTAAKTSIHIVRVPEPNTMADLMGEDTGHGALRLVADGAGVHLDLSIGIATTGREAG